MKRRIAYRTGYAYKLVDDYVCRLTFGVPLPSINTRWVTLSLDRLLIKAGYAWDGATGMPDSPDVIRGSLVHDALYQLMREGLLAHSYRDAVDRQLELMCLEDGMARPVARVVYEAVRTFGAAKLVEQPHQILYAPPAPAEPREREAPG